MQRQACAGLLWTKQFYHYSVELWLDGDPAGPEPPPERRQRRNAGWQHVYNLDVLSVPDKWEYPWFAAWDTAFHCIVLARLDPEWAKRQLVLLLARMVHAPERSAPGLRVGLFRRQPAGARPRGAAGFTRSPAT